MTTLTLIFNHNLPHHQHHHEHEHNDDDDVQVFRFCNQLGRHSVPPYLMCISHLNHILLGNIVYVFVFSIFPIWCVYLILTISFLVILCIVVTTIQLSVEMLVITMVIMMIEMLRFADSIQVQCYSVQLSPQLLPLLLGRTKVSDSEF